MVDILLQHNPQLLNARNTSGSTPLHIACEYNSHNVIRLLLTHPAIVVYATDDDLRTPLHDICKNGNAECARLLIRKNFEGIDIQDNKGNTALHRACTKGDAATIKMLVEEGASSTIKNDDQWTPLAVLKGEHFNNLDPVIGQRMVSATDSHNNTQLHLLAIGEVAGDSALQFLTERGVSAWSRNNYGKTAADMACDEYHHVLQQYYVKRTPLMKSMLDKQEQLMHSFLRTTSQYTRCAIFKQMFAQCGLLPDVQQNIMQYYYKLNIETVVARKYKDNSSYYTLDTHKKDEIRKALRNKPENPHLLWRDVK
jgi:ankyrin repeat protein